ncbi:MAG: multidrug effflux MFS transporter [Pseudomonadota bacterium]|nr:multidrug effflux MFS transporter [Pseudomonadota bacterium]
MTEAPPPHPATQTAPIPLGEFVAMVAALMALGALGVDAMLPSLPRIGAELHAGGANAQQYVISVYLVGLGVGQLLHGPLSDHFGRRPVLIAAVAVYFITNIAAALAGSFDLLLMARFIGAVAVAATRVVTVAMVRDCYSGRPMAKVMSLAAMVFMIAPVLAPTMGQGILLFGSWRLIFGIIAALTLIVGLWYWRRMPETLAREDALPYSVTHTLLGVRQTLSDRSSLGYMLAATMIQGGLFGYITSIQQIVAGVFGRPRLLTIVFAVTAGTMAVANLVNSRLVMRLGSRLLSHTALSVLIGLAAIALALGLTGHDTLAAFMILQALVMGCVSLSNSNFSAMAMTNMGAIAGTASSVQGFTIITGGAVIGALIGQAYAGTTVPLHLGFVLCGIVAFAVVFVTERGRMFRPV